MAPVSKQPRKHLHSPVGCEGYLTRRQAAQALGFASEFKIRELERKGMLRSVRGPMRAAFYPRPEILAIKAQLASSESGPVPPEAWSDAELLTLLGHPKRTGERRTIVDLVLETRISIERAERVYDFWMGKESARRPAPSAERATEAPSSAGSRATVEPPVHQERRGEIRLSRDDLIRSLRDPDPRIREQAFAKLKQGETV